jgi:hypothetical protein
MKVLLLNRTEVETGVWVVFIGLVHLFHTYYQPFRIKIRLFLYYFSHRELDQLIFTEVRIRAP